MASSPRSTEADQPVRACTNCVRAKARCSPSLRIGQACERCHRMKKTCVPSPPVRKRRARTAHPSAAKVERLEETLDGLVTFLKSAAQSNNPIFTRPSPVSGQDYHQHDHGRADELPEGSVAAHGPHRPNGGLPITPAASTTSVTASNTDSGRLPFPAELVQDLSSDDAESYLDRFRVYLAPQLPFLIIPPTCSAQQLQHDSPLLWLVIVCIASPITSQKAMLSKEIRVIFGKQAYVEGTRNMDFLLAIMCYAAWDRNKCKSLVSSLIQLAVAVLYDLGLDKPPPNNHGLHLEYELQGLVKPHRFTRLQTLEERRALIGLFLLSSLPSIAPKGQPLRWTAYFDECLDVLAREKDAETDAVLVHLAKIRLVSERAIDISNSVAPEEHGSSRPGATFYLRSLIAQLQHAKSSIPLDLAYNEVVLMEFHMAEMTVHELAFSQVPNLFPSYSSQRVDSLFACAQAASRWIDVFLRVPPARFIGFTAATFAQMTKVLIDAWRLTTFDHPQWDRSVVIDMMAVSEQFARAEVAFAQVRSMANLDPGDPKPQDFYTIMSRKMGSLATWWNGTVAPAAPVPPSLSSSAAVAAATAAAATVAPDAGPMLPTMEDLADFPMDFFDTWNW